MAQVDLIDEHVSSKQCELAVAALLKHEQQRQEKLQESQLLPGKEQNVWLVLTVKQMHPEKKLKPHKIPIVHPLVDPRTSGVCLITKDPQREYKDLLEEHKIKFVSRVLGIEKLKGKWKPFEARRLLLKENDLFLADERVVPLLPKLLGKKFFEAKKQPIPVNLTRKDLKGELERAISSTYFHQNQGTCSSIKVGTLSQTPAQVLDNLKTALPAVAKAVKDGWENIQSLHIKTNTSTSLPIWSCDLTSEDGGRWAGLADVAMASSDSGEGSGEEESEAEAEVSKGTRSKKGKKRAAEDDEEEQPKKKAKAAPEPVAATEVKKKRKGKAVDAPEPSAPSPSTETNEPSSGEPTKKKKRKAQAAADATLTPSPSTPSTSTPAKPADASPATPKAGKKKARAQATDFFDDSQTTPASSKIAPPPNTPADGLASAAAQTPANPKKKRKGKNATAEVEETPISKAIEKLSVTEEASQPAGPVSSEAVSGEEAAKESDGAKPAKKPKRKNAKAGSDGTAVAAPKEAEQVAPAAASTSDDVVSALTPEDGEKKKKRKPKKAAGEAADAVPAPPVTVTVDEVKQKLGASGVEKKKEKTKKAAKRSAKDAVLGKKSV